MKKLLKQWMRIAGAAAVAGLASLQAQSAAPAAASGAVSAATETSPPLLGQVPNALPVNAALPTLWIIGDSTVRNGANNNGPKGQWGWGGPIEYYFDLSKINVVNRAISGTSSRSFYTDRWKAVLDHVKKGDFVLMQFGANDNGSAITGKTSLHGAGAETQDANGETVHTFGWYMEQYVKETREKGATPIICSLTPRNRWTADGKFQRDESTHVAWAAAAAKATNTPYINLYELIARKSEEIGKDKAATYYGPLPTEYLHTVWYGAVSNAECVISGLKALQDDPLAKVLSARGQAIKAAPAECVDDNVTPAKPTEVPAK
jgi:lysophospholipase L1-like esterase